MFDQLLLLLLSIMSTTRRLTVVLGLGLNRSVFSRADGDMGKVCPLHAFPMKQFKVCSPSPARRLLLLTYTLPLGTIPESSYDERGRGFHPGYELSVEALHLISFRSRGIPVSCLDRYAPLRVTFLHRAYQFAFLYRSGSFARRLRAVT